MTTHLNKTRFYMVSHTPIPVSSTHLGLSMATTQATGVNEDATLLADNDPIPDYINDADVTGYMA